MQAATGDETSQARESRGECAEQLAEVPGLDLQFGDTGALAGDAQKFNVHDEAVS
jgi:hypothetical protein